MARLGELARAWGVLFAMVSCDAPAEPLHVDAYWGVAGAPVGLDGTFRCSFSPARVQELRDGLPLCGDEDPGCVIQRVASAFAESGRLRGADRVAADARLLDDLTGDPVALDSLVGSAVAVALRCRLGMERGELPDVRAVLSLLQRAAGADTPTAENIRWAAAEQLRDSPRFPIGSGSQLSAVAEKLTGHAGAAVWVASARAHMDRGEATDALGAWERAELLRLGLCVSADADAHACWRLQSELLAVRAQLVMLGQVAARPVDELYAKVVVCERTPESRCRLYPVTAELVDGVWQTVSERPECRAWAACVRAIAWDGSARVRVGMR